jgi:hypothetical protein
MFMLTLLMGIVLALVILCAVYTYMPAPLHLVLSILIIVVMLLVTLLSVFGWLGPLSQPIGRVR